MDKGYKRQNKGIIYEPETSAIEQVNHARKDENKLIKAQTHSMSGYWEKFHL